LSQALELKNLCKSFGGLHAVCDVTLKIMPGDRRAIIGPNGAGKTTLFNVITGIFPATSGQVVLYGQDITHWTSHRRAAAGMARTFQITSLFPRLTVLDNVLLAIKGVRASKFVMWRTISSYADVYDKAHGLSSRPTSSTARTSRFAISRMASSASSRSCSASPAIPRSCCWTSRRRPVVGRVPRWPSSSCGSIPARDPADRARHGRGVRRGGHISVLHFGEVLEAGTPSRSAQQPRCRKSIWGPLIMAILEVTTSTPTMATPTSPGAVAALEQGRSRAARAQRRRQDHAGQLDRRLQSAAPRQDRVQGRGHHRNSSFETVRSGMGLVPQGGACFPP
jgi:branched-chain amino acid transport system ATP-binding protein